jgi:hypothetical protein
VLEVEILYVLVFKEVKSLLSCELVELTRLGPLDVINSELEI